MNFDFDRFYRAKIRNVFSVSVVVPAIIGVTSIIGIIIMS